MFALPAAAPATALSPAASERAQLNVLPTEFEINVCGSILNGTPLHNCATVLFTPEGTGLTVTVVDCWELTHNPPMLPSKVYVIVCGTLVELTSASAIVAGKTLNTVLTAV